MNDLLRNNTAVKILSIVLSIVLWFYVLKVENPPVERMIYVTPQIQNLKETYIRETKLPKIKIKLRGQRNHINLAEQRDQVEATLNLKTARVGTNTVLVKVTVPTGMELVDYEPRSVNIFIDTVQERQFPLEIVVAGNPAEGYTTGQGQLDQSFISIKGTTKRLNQIQKCLVQADVKDVDKDYIDTLSVYPVDAQGKKVTGVNVVPKTVQVVIPIYKLETSGSTQVPEPDSGKNKPGSNEEDMGEGEQKPPQTDEEQSPANSDTNSTNQAR